MSKSEISGLSKEEISIKLNDMLSTEGIDFSKMTKEDLIKLYDTIGNVLKPLGSMTLREFLDSIFSDKPLGQRILPRIRQRVRELIREERKPPEATAERP